MNHRRGYRFWIDSHGEGHRTLGIPIPTAEERQYWDELTGLSAELAKELRKVQDAAKESLPTSGAVATPASSGERPTVFLAEATDDLYYVRKQVVDYSRHLHARNA